jgi:hypothetical protein
MIRRVVVIAVLVVMSAVAYAQSFGYPGDGNTIPCPCGNGPAAPFAGCNNSANTGGAVLSATSPGSLSSDGVVLSASGMLPHAACIFLQSNQPVLMGSPFGDGVLCLSSNGLIRLNTTPKQAVGGASSYPQAGDLSISARSAQAGAPIPPNSSRYYQVYYRDPANFACPSPATYNASSGAAVFWFP